MLRPWQRKQGPPSREATPIAQNRRRLCRCRTTAAPASRAAASPRGPTSGSMLCTCTTCAPRLRTAAASSCSPLPPRSSARAAAARLVSAERRSSKATLHTRTPQRPQLQLHRPLLSPLDAVAVVDYEHTRGRHRPGLRYPPDGRARGDGGGPHARPARVSRGDARLAAAPAHADPLRASRGRRRSRRRHPRGGAARGSPLRQPRPAPRPQRRAQHRDPRERRAADPFVDDDVLAPPGWLEALARGAERHPEAEAFGGPIRARFEGGGPRSCGREDPPITTLDLGPRRPRGGDGVGRELRRARARRSSGSVTSTRASCVPDGDEEEWLERLRAAGGTIVYLAAAGLDHRRTADDARLAPLARAAYARGRGARASDRRRRRRPRPARTSCGCWPAAAGTPCAGPVRRA